MTAGPAGGLRLFRAVLALGVTGGLLAALVLGWPIAAAAGLSQLTDSHYEAQFCQLAEPLYGAALLTISALGAAVCVWGVVRAVQVVRGRREDSRFIRAVVATAALFGLFVVVVVPLRPDFDTVERDCLGGDASGTPTPLN